MPARRASSRRAAPRRSSSVGRRRSGRLGGHADPAGLVRRARHPRRELLGAIPGEDQMGVRVDEAGDHAATPGVEVLVAGGAGRLDGAHRPVLDHQRRIAHEPQRPVAELRVVGDQQPDPVDHERAHGEPLVCETSRHRRRRSRRAARPRRRSPRACPRSTTCRPDTITDRTSAALAAKTAAASAFSALGAREPNALEIDRDQVGDRVRLDSPGVGPADARVPLLAGGPQQLRRVVMAALAGDEPLVELDGAHLLELVDHRVRVGAERQPGAGVGDLPRAPDAVGEVALGGRAQAAMASPLAEQADVLARDVGEVHGREPLRERSGVGEHRRRAPAVGRDACLVLGRLLGDVRVQRPVATLRPSGDHRGGLRVDRADAVDRGAGPGARPRSPRSSTRSAQAAALSSPKRSWSGSSGAPNPPCR